MRKKILWYFPLEDVPSRYTSQLCREWMPDAFMRTGWDYVAVYPDGATEHSIKVGQVLDATGRGLFSLDQCSSFLRLIQEGEVRSGDVLFFQDYWTPGVEAILYALHLYEIEVNIFSMLHAQSVDEYDFTYPMRSWMRGFEIGFDRAHAGIFVASTIHKQQLREAGFEAPIYVVGLPFGKPQVLAQMDTTQPKRKQVIFCSRLDREKNPLFMMQVATQFLHEHPDWEWVVTTSASSIRSNDPDVLVELNTMQTNPRFKVKVGLSKQQYYDELCKSSIQINTAWQDYVSWTLLEATTAGCDICYPAFRSFPECVPADRLYEAFSLVSALEVLDRCIASPRQHQHISDICNEGRLMEAVIMKKRPLNEFNVWEDRE